jgi:hypothetical protein
MTKTAMRKLTIIKPIFANLILTKKAAILTINPTNLLFLFTGLIINFYVKNLISFS